MIEADMQVKVLLLFSENMKVKLSTSQRYGLKMKILE